MCRIGGGYLQYLQPATEGDGNVILLKGSAQAATGGPWALAGGWAYTGDASNNQIHSDVSATTAISGPIFGGYVDGPNGTGNANNNQIELKNSVTTTIVSSFIYGGYVNSSGNANNNSISLVRVEGATQIIGGYVLAPGNLKEGNAKGNNVELQNSSVAGFVSGALSEAVGDLTGNVVKIENSLIADYVAGANLQMAGNGDTNDNQVLIKNTNIQGSPNGLGVTGGYNISIAGGSADGNVVDVIADSEYGEANLVINKFISGGLIGSVGTADRVGNTNNNQVTLTNTRGNGKLEINGYVAGGANFATGIGDASGNKVFINPPQTGENYLIDIKEYVLGGLVGTAGTGKTNKNLVSIQNSHVTQYITGGYNQGAGQVSASENEVYLKGVSLYDSGVVDGRFVVGGLLSNSEGTGDAYKNKVVLEKSKFTGKYIAGGVSQGTGLVDLNEVSLVDTDVVGFVAGGLDWYGKDVTLTNNKVSVAGGSVVGRVAGARSWTGSDVNFNSVYVQSAKIKAGGENEGHVLGAANQSGGNALNNYVQVQDSQVDGYVAGGFIEHYEGGHYNGKTDNNNVVIENSNVYGNIGGGYNQAGGTLSASGNTVVVKILSTASEISFEAAGFIAGGIIGDKQKGAGVTNSNTVKIINSSSENSFEINGYVAGGYNGGVGEGGASGNIVFIDTARSPNGSNSLVTVGEFVLGGYIGSELADSTPNGDTNKNSVSIQNTQVTTYIAGGYNLGKKGNAVENNVYLKNVTLYDGDDIDGHFVVGGLIGEGSLGNATNNTVTVEDSSLKGKYLAGGVSQGNGLVDKNKTILTNTHVQGFVAGGLDWGDHGNVTLTNNEVWMNGGSVSVVSGESLTGRVVGARSKGSGDVLNNAVHLRNVTIEDGVRGGVSTGNGNVAQNVITIEDSEITGWSNQGGSVAGGYIEAGGNGNTNENSVSIKNTNVAGNVVAGFNQAVGSSDSCNNLVLFEVDPSSTDPSYTAGGFVAGGITGMQSEGAANNNKVTIINTSLVAELNVKGYVAGGFNDGTGNGDSSGNTVWLEAASVSTSKLTVDNFVVGGYLRSGEGSTNGNTVVIKNAAVSGSYIAAGLNEGLGQAQNNSVILENAEVSGGVTGGRVTATPPTSGGRSLNAANSNIGESSENYSALVQNNTINISGKTSVVGRVVGGESLAGNSVTEKPAYIQNNTVVIDDGYVEGGISGGAAVAGNVIGNKVFLNGGTIKGLVYGGTSAGDVKNNVVYLDGRKGIDVTGAWIYGRGRASTGTNGNTLNITNFKGAVQNIGNVDRIDLDLAGLMVREKEPIILLTENQSTNLDNSTIHIHSSRKAIAVTDDSSLADRYEVIKNQSGSLTAFNVIYEKDKLVVVHERGTMEGLYRVEWDGYPDQIGDSIDLVLERVEERPESGTYISNSLAWSRMHMRLHDRFGQAYYIDPFSGEERAAAGWVRQVGSHSHFRAGSDIKTHSRTAVTQIGADLVRNEFNQDVKSVWGIFAGGLYNRSSAKTYSSAQSRSDGYALGVYGTLYTGNSPDDGFYVDSWLLFGHYNNKLWSEDLANFRYKSNGWVWSVESGYTIPLSQSGSKDFNKLIWTFQPEIQLVWDGVKADTTVDKDTETRFKQLGTNNVSLRIGARLHANHMNKGLGFIEGNWIHNTKRAGVQMGTGCKYIKGGRNLAEFRAGLEGHVTKNLLGWATVGVQAGQYGYHNETAQIGLKYMF